MANTCCRTCLLQRLSQASNRAVEDADDAVATGKILIQWPEGQFMQRIENIEESRNWVR
jgi:hypothetical protein